MVYEINFLILQSKTTELEKIKKETKKFIESFKAKIVEEKEYLKRKLAYEIQHESYGFFTVLRFEFPKSKNLDELKKALNQRTEIARYIIVRADELPSLKEQDVKELEKIHSDKKSIKSEDVEKAIKEQALAEKKAPKKPEKPETKKKSEEKSLKKNTKPTEKGKTEEAEKKPTTKKASTVKKTKKKLVEKEVKKTEKLSAEKIESKKETKTKKETPEEKGKVSLDELDKKLDEILNS